MKGILTTHSWFRGPVVKFIQPVTGLIEHAEVLNAEHRYSEGIILYHESKLIPYGSTIEFGLLNGRAKIKNK
jgi:hypothetical protein